MTTMRRGVMLGATGSVLAERARAATAIKLGVLTEMSSIYAEDSGAYDLVSTTPADRAFRPLADGNCPMIHA